MLFLKPKYQVIILLSIAVFSLTTTSRNTFGVESESAVTYIYVPVDSLTEEFFLEQLLSGAGGSVAFGLLGGYIGYLKDEREPHGCSYFPMYTFYGALAGATIGSSIGVYFYSNRGETRGSYLATLAGATVGPIVGAGIGTFFSWLLKEKGSKIVSIGFFSGFPLGATMGFNLTRKKRIAIETNDALLNFRNGKFALSIPKMEPNISQMDSGFVVQQHVSLLRINF